MADGADAAEVNLVEIITDASDLLKRESGSYAVELLNRPTLRRVPAALHSVNPQAFTPVTVAIGPLHRHLIKKGMYAYSFSEMERCKLIATQAICSNLRGAKQQLSFISTNSTGLVDAALSRASLFMIGDMAEILKRSYSPEFGMETFSEESLMCMFTLDACFIVEMMRCLYRSVNSDKDASMRIRSEKGNAFSGAFQSMAYPTRKAVVLDLLLMENQLPLFLVKRIMAVDGRHIDGESRTVRINVDQRLSKMIASIARKVLPFCKGVSATSAEVSTAEHLLDCLYKVVTAGSDNSTDKHNEVSGENNTTVAAGGTLACLPTYKSAGFYQQASTAAKRVAIPTATELRRAGVKFVGHKGSLRRVSMVGNTLTLPIIHVGDETEKIFRNLLAHETQTYRTSVVVLSYLHFMNSLINTVDDVAVLSESGVVTESIGDHKSVAQMWNRLATNTPCVYTGAYRTVAKATRCYVDDSLHVYFHEFSQRYLSRPWLAVSLMSGIAFLVMSFITTYYTVKLYYHDCSTV